MTVLEQPAAGGPERAAPVGRRPEPKGRLAPPDLILTALTPLFFVAIVGGNWLQLVPIGSGLGLYGLAWTAVLLTSAYFFFFGGPRPGQTATVAAVAAAVTVALISIGTVRNGFGGQAIPVLISIIGIMMMLAFGSSVSRYQRPTNKLIATVEAALILQATLIVPKVALVGTNAVVLSSRPFGLAAAVAFAWRLHRHRSPLATLLDPISWVLVSCALLSQSRTAFLGMALSLVASSIAAQGFRAQHIVRALVVVFFVIGATLGIVQTSETARDRLFGQREIQTEQAELNLNLSNRENIWPDLVREILKDPITPNGAGSAATFVQEVSDGEHANPHNDYLRMAFDAGVVGVAALLGVLVWVIVRAVRTAAQRPLAIAAINICLTLGVAMAFTNVLTYLSVSWPAFFLAAAAVDSPRRRSRAHVIRKGAPA